MSADHTALVRRIPTNAEHAAVLRRLADEWPEVNYHGGEAAAIERAIELLESTPNPKAEV